MTETERKKIKWLEEYGSIQKRIDRLEMEIEEWRTRLEGLGAQIIDGMPKTHGKRKSWVKEITEIERLDDELTKELLKLRNKRLAIIDAINTLQDPVLQVLVEYRYIDNMRWEEICTKMHYSWRHVHRLHMIAIRKLKIENSMYYTHYS